MSASAKTITNDTSNCNLMLEAAIKYSDWGFATIPLYGATAQGCVCGKADCNSPGKHPWTANGLKNASHNPEVLTTLFRHKTNANIGIVTGPISNIFVVDIDGPLGESSLQSHPAFPPTLSSTTGRGRHLFFRYPERKVYTRAGKFAPGLDIRGEGGYVVAPPSIHHTGIPYEWMDESTPIAPAPDWLLDIICRDPSTNYTPSAPLPPSNDGERWSVDEVRDMLSFIDPDCGYDEWIEIGMALHSDGFGLAIWDEWSARGIKYKPGCTIPHWRSFRPSAGISMGTLVHTASLNGWKPAITDTPLSLDDHPAREFILRVQRGEFLSTTIDRTNENKQLFNPLKLPGLVGDTVREIVETSQKPQPELALLNTLAALGAVFGRRYASPMDTRTNLYTVGIAVTAAGKDHSRRFIKRLMVESKLDSYLGEDTIISGAGLLSSIEKRPAQIMHLDEFGMLLEAITDQRGAPYMKAASKVITEMYSTSSGVFFGGQYADKREAVKINNPNLCIYGTTTPEKYIASMNKTAIASGELNRFLVIRPAIDRPQRRRYMGGAAPSSQLISQWAALSGSLNSALITPDVINVSWSGCDERVWNMGLYEDDKIAASGIGGPLWGRYRENVIKVAMIFAIARNNLVPVITNDDFDIAEAIVSQAVEYALDLANNHMADSDHERDCLDILDVIAKHGGRLSKTELSRGTQRMDVKQRENALKSLIDQDRIEIISENANKGAGRPKIYYCKK